MLSLTGKYVLAQRSDSLYVHLYTDSLKKGAFNYINIDGILPNGHYVPLDSSQLIFQSSAGRFYGNTLWIDNDFLEDKVTIKTILRKNPAVYKEFSLYIKKKEDTVPLKTIDEIINNKVDNRNRKIKKKKGWI